MPDPAKRFRLLVVCVVVLCVGSIATAQIPTSFEIPVLGYLFDDGSRSIRPVSGILGNSHIDVSLPLELVIEKIAFMPDQRHAIVSAAGSPEGLILDLRDSKTLIIRGVPQSITEIRTSPTGSVAAFFYADARKIVVVSGLPDVPVIRATIDVSFVNDVLQRFAVSEDGTALLDFSSVEKETLYSWTASAGPRYISSASRISDMTFVGDDAVYVDAGSNQAFRIRNVREQVVPEVIADSGDGLSDPVAVYFSARNEIYVGDSDGGILVLDSTGHILRRTRCSCAITTMAPLAKSAIRLTDRIDQPMYVLDGSEADRILFIPALSPQPLEEIGQ